jgi:hypothetical protein
MGTWFAAQPRAGWDAGRGGATLAAAALVAAGVGSGAGGSATGGGAGRGPTLLARPGPKAALVKLPAVLAQRAHQLDLARPFHGIRAEQAATLGFVQLQRDDIELFYAHDLAGNHVIRTDVAGSLYFTIALSAFLLSHVPQ